jgi:hypothetical protein
MSHGCPAQRNSKSQPGYDPCPFLRGNYKPGVFFLGHSRASRRREVGWPSTSSQEAMAMALPEGAAGVAAMELDCGIDLCAHLHVNVLRAGHV